eukprot:60538-Amphidinium_carterae.1
MTCHISLEAKDAWDFIPHGPVDISASAVSSTANSKQVQTSLTTQALHTEKDNAGNCQTSAPSFYHLLQK